MRDENLNSSTIKLSLRRSPRSRLSGPHITRSHIEKVMEKTISVGTSNHVDKVRTCKRKSDQALTPLRKEVGETDRIITPRKPVFSLDKSILRKEKSRNFMILILRQVIVKKLNCILILPYVSIVQEKANMLINSLIEKSELDRIGLIVVDEVDIIIITFSTQYFSILLSEATVAHSDAKIDARKKLIDSQLEISLLSGVAYHHSGLTHDERKHIESAYVYLALAPSEKNLLSTLGLPEKRILQYILCKKQLVGWSSCNTSIYCFNVAENMESRTTLVCSGKVSLCLFITSKNLLIVRDALTEILIPLMSIDGVKRKRAHQLYAAGYKTVAIIAKADYNNILNDIANLSKFQAVRIINSAKQLYTYIYIFYIYIYFFR
uniref:Helicase ATP-binding domain-containing protein n=1 Tax=Heterorhabditis bacteriophora TaxID=37862 RepID=A0A1I7WWI4_HETBA